MTRLQGSRVLELDSRGRFLLYLTTLPMDKTHGTKANMAGQYKPCAALHQTYFGSEVNFQAPDFIGLFLTTRHIELDRPWYCL